MGYGQQSVGGPDNWSVVCETSHTLYAKAKIYTLEFYTHNGRPLCTTHMDTVNRQRQHCSLHTINVPSSETFTLYPESSKEFVVESRNKLATIAKSKKKKVKMFACIAIKYWKDFFFLSLVIRKMCHLKPYQMNCLKGISQSFIGNGLDELIPEISW